ncbi:hypothetical protein TREVI0001_0166 [Treponema vincentii ATCC 35580]|uniref:Uncharacterized protein n=1 Tax=Treponema vincentii ATCC 35580 TaxID=596324 RepID=C8PTM6_9SPIR|nr:hypothetical protein TREVI0001_0166 [Treponema vincentii ATCC 35580]
MYTAQRRDLTGAQISLLRATTPVLGRSDMLSIFRSNVLPGAKLASLSGIAA